MYKCSACGSNDRDHICPGPVAETVGEHRPSLYDIGAFLAGGLNETTESMRARLTRLRDQFGHLERDQEDHAAVEYDTLLDLIEIGERMLDMWDDDAHVIVTSGYDNGGWTIEHSLRCRATGAMASCQYHVYSERISAEVQALPAGRYKINLAPDGKGASFRPAP